MSAFHRRSDRAGGRQSKCAECANEMSRLHKAAHQEYYRARWRDWSAAHPGYSTRWARKNRQRHLEQWHKWRATRLGLFVEDVDRQKLWRMHSGLCGICSQTVAAEEFHIDHIVPIVRGGEHSYRNTRPTHRICNQRKSLTDRRSG